MVISGLISYPVFSFVQGISVFSTGHPVTRKPVKLFSLFPFIFTSCGKVCLPYKDGTALMLSSAGDEIKVF